MSCLEIDPEKDAPEWSVLTDNRDFKAMPSWDPIDRAVNDDLISESFLLDQKFLKFRSLTMRALATAVYISEDIHPSRIAASNMASKSKKNGQNEVILEKLNDSERATFLCPVLKKLIEGLVQHQKEVAKDPVDFTALNKSAFGPDTSRLTLYVKSFHIDLLVTLLNLTHDVYKLVCTKDPVEQVDLKQSLTILSKNSIAKFQDIVTNVTELVNTHGPHLFGRHEKLELIVNATESSSFAAILCGVCQVLLKSGNKFLTKPNQADSANNSNTTSNAGKASSNKVSKKKGNKNSSVTNIEIRKDLFDFYSVFNEIIRHFGESTSSLLLVVENFEKIVADDQVSILQNKISSLKLVKENGKIQKQCESKLKIIQNHTEPDENDKKEEEKLQGRLSLDEIQLDILKQTESSYGISFLQIKTVLQNKQNYFSFLKCDTGSNPNVK